MRRAPRLAVALVVLAACGGGDTLESQLDIDAPSDIRVESAFEDGQEVPVEFTCEGKDVSPPISWTAEQIGQPQGGQVPRAAEYALIVTDPDAPEGTFVHWVLYGIPGSVDELDRGAIPQGALEGENSSGDTGYGGPCPPPGDDPHRYEFTVYELDDSVAEDLEPGASAEEVLSAIRPAVAAQGTLTGTYSR